MSNNSLVTRPNIEQIVAFHDETLRLYEEAFEDLERAQDSLSAARKMAANLSVDHNANSFAINHVAEVSAFNSVLTLPPRDDYMRVARRITAIRTWAYLIERTNLEMLMDAEAKAKLRRQMAYEIPAPIRDRQTGEILNQEDLDNLMPEITVGNVEATIDGFMADALNIWRRGIANAFCKLDRRFRSHDGFKIGSRVILTHVFNEFGSWSYHGKQRDTLIDIERIFHIMEGEKPPMATYAGAIGSIDSVRGIGANGPKQSEIETQFFRLRVFKNGNLHIWFRDKDLLARVNRELAAFYGEVIGDGMQAEEDPLANVKHTPAKRYGFFPTPKPAAEHVFKRVSLVRSIEQPPMRILEPSAGTGNLARVCVDGHAQLEKWSGGRAEHASKYHARNLVDCVEIQPYLANDLKAEGIYNRVMVGDFLSLTPESTGLYDLIVANPPFDRERDIDHVHHMLRFLKDTGTLVAVMSAGTEFRTTKKAQAFRDLVIDKMGGMFFDLPAGSFAEVGTQVNTIILKVHKSGKRVNSWE